MVIKIFAPINTTSIVYSKNLVNDPAFVAFLDNTLWKQGKNIDIRKHINAPRPLKYLSYDIDVEYSWDHLQEVYNNKVTVAEGNIFISSEGTILFVLSLEVNMEEAEELLSGYKRLHSEFEELYWPAISKVKKGITGYCFQNQKSILGFQFAGLSHSKTFSWKYFFYSTEDLALLSQKDINSLLLLGDGFKDEETIVKKDYIIGWEASIASKKIEQKLGYLLMIMSFLWQEYYNLDELLDSELIVLRNDFLKRKFHHANQKYIRLLKIYSDIAIYKSKESNYSLDLCDIDILKSVSETWEVLKLKENIASKIQNLHELYQIVLDEDKEKHSTILNYTMGFFTILGFVGLLVSLLQFYDFDNHVFSKGERFYIIVYSLLTIIAILIIIVILLMLMGYGKRKTWK